MVLLMFSLIITVCTIGVVLIGSMIKHELEAQGRKPITFKKSWLILFGTPILNLFTLVGVILIGVFHTITDGPIWIAEKLDMVKKENDNDW